MKVYENNIPRVLTSEEIAALEEVAQNAPEPIPTPEERIAALEQTKAEQVDVDELHEALEMILTGVTE